MGKLIDENGIRTDGRKFDELRPLSIKEGVLRNADGSAEINWGNNKILVGVFGPHSAPSSVTSSKDGTLRCNYRMATFSVESRKSLSPTRREHELSFIMTRALRPALFLEEFPRSVIDVYAYVFNADGGTRTASITAASVALAAAGLPMKGLVAACASGKVEGTVVLDINDIEDKEGEADMPVAVLFPSEEITMIQLNGKLTMDEFLKALDLAIDGCRRIYKIQREALLARYKEIKERIEKEEKSEEGGSQ